MAKAIEGPISFLRSNNFLRIWSPQQGQVCELAHVALSSTRPPPTVVHAAVKEVQERPKKEIAPRQRKTPQDRTLKMINDGIKVAEAIGAFSAWLKSPPLPPPAPPPVAAKPPPAPPAPKPVPPFDIQDVPKAMRKVGMPMAAKLQERWFAGQENYSISAQDLLDELDQNGKRYAPAMVDSTTVKMEWVLSFKRAKEAADELIQQDLRHPEAVKTLKGILAPYRNRSYILGWNEANSDFLQFHKTLQFQLKKVNATWGQRIAEFLVRSTTAAGVPDDLTGALGSFNFYAAVAIAHFQPAGAYTEAIVTHVSVYVRDPYEFSDDQYLGHWSPSHVAVVPAHQAAGGKGWLDYPVVQGSIYDKNSVLYPVTNKDYRDWRQKHRQGGDFMIYTDRLTVRLPSPIRVLL
jgi:hypothetical protein